MNKVVKIFIVVILISTWAILYNTSNFAYNQEFLNIERTESSQNILIATKYEFQEEIYYDIVKILDEYNSNIFFTNNTVINNKTFYTKYIYVVDDYYEKNIPLIEGRFFLETEFNSDKYISTEVIKDELQVGRLLSFGKNSNFIIKPLNATLTDKVALSGNFTIMMYDLNNLDEFINELNKIDGVSAVIKDNTFSGMVTFPFEILVFFEYILLGIFILYQIINSFNKIAIKKMHGYSTFDIWSEYLNDILKFQFISSFVIVLLSTLIFYENNNKIIITFIMSLIKIYSVELICSFIVITIPFMYLRKVNIINLLKKMSIKKSIGTLNSLFKFILTFTVLILLSNSFTSFQTSTVELSETYKYWEKAKDYYIIPIGSNMTIDYLHSDEYLMKQKELYTVLNENGAILADFAFYLDIYDEDYKYTEIYERSATVNPNYLIENNVYDIAGNRIVIDENDDDYIVLVNEKLMPKKIQLEEYIRFIKNSRSDKIKDQDIKIIWVQDNQKLFTYNLEINIEKDNLVDLNILNVLTLENGDYTDYDRIIGYQGDPFKIYIEEGLGVREYLMPKTDDLDLSKHIKEVYSLYDTVNAEIKRSKDIILQQVVGMLFLFVCIMLSIYQNIYIFIKNESRAIFVKMINGHKFFSKFYKYYLYQGISWVILIFIFILLSGANGLDLFNKQYILICIIYILGIECLVSYICFKKLEKKNITKLLKGGE